jgi:hypothetical protein
MKFFIKVANGNKYSMTKKLEDLFNLESTSPTSVEPAPIVEETPAVEPPTHEAVDNIEKTSKEIQRITSTLPQIQELNDLDDKELDHLADKAEKAYDDLMDLGMNVEVRYSGRIFEVASSMLGNAINAKTAKLDKKLKAVDLQLKKLKMDKDQPDDPNDIVNGTGYVITDRNELLKKLGQKD